MLVIGCGACRDEQPAHCPLAELRIAAPQMRQSDDFYAASFLELTML